jgi:hypothetical protein
MKLDLQPKTRKTLYLVSRVVSVSAGICGAVITAAVGASEWLPVALSALLIIQSELHKLASDNVDLEFSGS